MTHALAEATVLVEQFRLYVGGDGQPYLDCPGCDWISPDDVEIYTLGEALTAARRHILEDHAGHHRPDHERAYTTALKAVDQLTGDPYPLFDLEPGVGSRSNSRCEACGRTVRGPLLPSWRPDEPLLRVGPGCFKARRRNVSHVADQLPMPPAGEGADHG